MEGRGRQGVGDRGDGAGAHIAEGEAGSPGAKIARERE